MAFWAATLTNLALGFKTSMALVFLRGFLFWFDLLTDLLTGLMADWISLELMILAKSGLVTSWEGRLYPFFWTPGYLWVPKILLSSSKAP